MFLLLLISTGIGFGKTQLECGIMNFSGPTGQISSPNFPSRYTNNLDCYNYITVPSGQTIIITFLEFFTQPTSDYLTITCASGNEFTTSRYSGFEFPAVLTISSCNIVNIYFHTDNSEVHEGFSLSYNVTSDVVTGGITTRPSNAFARSDIDDPVIFNCTTASKFFPWWTFSNEIFGIVTATNATCGVNTLLHFDFLVKTETLGSGSCNLIAVLPAHIRNNFGGSLVCTDSTLSTARAIVIPVNSGMRSIRSIDSFRSGIDTRRDWDIKISCDASFTYLYSPVFTYFLYGGGPVLQMRIVRTYWTSEGKVVAGTYISNSSSYILVKAPHNGVIPRYTCNIVCDLFSNFSDIKVDSTIEISFSTDSASMRDFVCAEKNFSGIMGQISSSDSTISNTSYTDCYNYYIILPAGKTLIVSFLALLNTLMNHAWVTIFCESGSTFRSPHYSGSLLPAVLTIPSCNIVTVHLHTNISILNTGFSLTYATTSDTVKGGFTMRPSNAFPRSDKDNHVIFNCTTASQFLPWWTINDKSRRNYTVTNSTCEVITSALYSSWFMTETLGGGSCNLIVVAPADKRHLLAGTVVCTDSTLASARAILAPIDLALILTRSNNSLAAVTDIVRDEEIRISCSSSFIFWDSRPSLDFTYFLYSGGPVVQMRISTTHWTKEGNNVSSTDTSDSSHSASYVSLKAPSGVIPSYTCNVVFDFSSNIYDISGSSSIRLSFNTDPVDVLYWPTADGVTITRHHNGPTLAYSLLYCNVAANPPATYEWIDESNGNIANGQILEINHNGIYTCNVSNTIRGHYYQQSRSVHVQGNIIGGLTTKPSNAFPRADTHDPVIFNCTTASEYLPWWTITPQGSQSCIVTNSTCSVITSVPYSSWFKTETLGPGSCNLIVYAPGNDLYLLAGIVVCTDSTLSSASAILAPVNLELRFATGMHSLAIVSDVVRDEEIRISCNASFSGIYSRSSLVFTISMNVGGPVVRVRILRMYLTSEGNDTSNTSSYVLVKAPKEGVIPPYTCNIVCDFYTDMRHLSGDSSMELSFSTDPLKVLYWPTYDNMRITGDNNGQLRTPTLLKCFAAANPPATYTWIDESNGNTINGPTITITHGGNYTCNASNIIRGQFYHQSKSITLQDKTTENPVVLVLLGVSVLTVIIILITIVIRLCHQQKRTIENAKEYELPQRGGEGNLYEAGLRNYVGIAESEYDLPDESERRLSNMSAIYDEIEDHNKGQELLQSGESTLHEKGLGNYIDVVE